MTAGTALILRKHPFSPIASGLATLAKKARVAGVKSITLNERGWKFQSDIRTVTVSCLKGRMGRSRIDRVKEPLFHNTIPTPIHSKLIRSDLRSRNGDVTWRSSSS
ncbi:hypothetical protein AVEN_115031-1 [Araneus ventricosus]|uniref:Uncharacterized protein n=1 Tax=Araneus ventricosus TaxID=182803 RepID=A0A4Y1ZYS0_ARAVE|nr:hypothetical protein AVEN_115031-1 [Araneus ventricosus]